MVRDVVAVTGSLSASQLVDESCQQANPGCWLDVGCYKVWVCLVLGGVWHQFVTKSRLNSGIPGNRPDITVPVDWA